MDMVDIKDNKGSSLVELVVSIAILGIILLPILNSFVVSARANAESKRVQTQNVIVQDIMEEMKGRKLEDIIGEYNLPGDDCYEVYISEAGTGFNLYPTNSYTIKDKYYLLKRNIDNKYDALITFDATPYNNTHVHRDTDYNNYQMPLVRGVNSSDHLVAIQSYETEAAISVLYANHVTYCHGLDADPLDISEVEGSINRTINVDVSLSGSSIHASVVFVYSSGIGGCGSVRYELETKELSSSDEGIYVFFKPFPSDSINIINSSGHGLDVFAYEQNDLPNLIPVSKPADINLYSNLPGFEPVKKEEAKNRIFNIRIELYSSNIGFDPDAVYLPGELYCQLESTRGK